MSRARWTDAAQRFADRRKREDDAQRLSAIAPRLETLKLEIEERRASSPSVDSKHVRHVVVGSAPALFVVACGDRECRDGGHDVTQHVLRALQSEAATFEVEDPCPGSIGNGRAVCGRVIRIVGIAAYR